MNTQKVGCNINLGVAWKCSIHGTVYGAYMYVSYFASAIQD